MPDTRLTGLTELTSLAKDDWLYVVDKSDTTDHADGSSKKITVQNVAPLTGLVATSTKTSNYTAVKGDLVICDLSAGEFTVTLPASPSAGDRVGVYYKAFEGNVTGATNATPIAITATAHGLSTGAKVTITDVQGNNSANRRATITKVNNDSYSLDSSVGSGTYTSNTGYWYLSGCLTIARNSQTIDGVAADQYLAGSGGYMEFQFDGSTWIITERKFNERHQVVLGASYSITSSNGVYQDTGLYVDLPCAGTYLVSAQTRGYIHFTSGGTGLITCKFYNSTDSADVANSEGAVVLGTVDNQAFLGSIAMIALVRVTGAKTIKLYAMRDVATAWSASDVQSNSYGRTKMILTRCI